MRNLRSIHYSTVQSPQTQQATAICWDLNLDDSAVCSFGPANKNSLLELKRWRKHEREWQAIASWDAPCPLPDLQCDKVVDLHYFSDTQTALLILAGGDLVVVREDPQDGEDKIEIVGSVDVGISAASWSPDEELLAVATRASTLLYMTREFENVAYVELTTEDLKASSAVSVGWGKKETQFKGKKDRALRDPTVPETIDEGVLHPLDDKSTTITWRGDGAFLAINSVVGESRRAIRVFSRDGVLDSVSEPADNLVGALSWRPAGNLIAAVQRSDIIRVLFFERNGLRHGQFDLRLTKREMEDWGSEIALQWNVDSSVLAVCFKDRVQLWTMGNHHYYLKQEILLFPSSPAGGLGVVDFHWHSEKPLHFLLSNGEILQRRAFASVITSGLNSPPHDYGLVAVIDGKVLKLTPLRLTNVPPPMSLHEMNLEDNVNDVVVAHRDGESDKTIIVLAILHPRSLSLCEVDAKHLAHTAPVLKWHTSLIEDCVTTYTVVMQLILSSANLIDVLQTDNKKWRLRRFDLKGVRLEDVDIGSKILGRVEGLASKRLLQDSEACIIIDSRYPSHACDGDESNDLSWNSVSKLSFREVSTQIIDSVMYQPSQRNDLNANVYRHLNSPNEVIANDFKDDNRSIFFYLNESSTLFADNRCLVKNCTSFLLTPGHLILTTGQHLLKFVHLRSDINDLEVPPDTPETDERCRSIERGAKLVTVMPSIFALVLQMPRGNLETIYPRALVLAGVRDNISRRKYKKAFLACRNQRVDMNILHDYNPEQFLSDIELFVDQVEKVEHIDLFLSQLREEDVSKTMYRETLKGDEGSNQLSISKESFSSRTSKINRICDGFLQVLHKKSSEYLQNIVSAHVCKSPPELDAGLIEIATLRRHNSDQVGAMVEHICFLADANRLYDNALGLYDLELTLLIAQQTQKDPREYIPFLQNLQKMPTLRMQYSIDDYLGRHLKALKHLCSIDAFEEVKSYTVKYFLYVQALEFYRYQEGKFSDILRLHADHLQQEGKFRLAGIAYEYLHDHTSASDSFRQAHLWRESLSNASLLPSPAPQVRSLAISLSDMLIETKDFFSAATINLDYLSDIPVAVRLSCKGYHFTDAIRIAGLHQRLDLLESVIDPGLVEGFTSVTELLADCKGQLNVQVPRILELRVKKAEDPLAFWDGDILGGGDVPDDVSIAPTDASTTGGSLFTRYTNRTGTIGTNATRRTSKNRRREERKRARGKKGSVYEEEYLVNSVRRLVERVNSVGDEVSRLVVGLMRRGMRERARAVEKAMLEVVEKCKGCTNDVFQSSKDERNETPGFDDVSQGGDNVLLASQESNKSQVPPHVKSFEKLSLFGE